PLPAAGPVLNWAPRPPSRPNTPDSRTRTGAAAANETRRLCPPDRPWLTNSTPAALAPEPSGELQVKRYRLPGIAHADIRALTSSFLLAPQALLSRFLG